MVITSPGVARPHFAYIDCTRGYAALMVITCHLTYLFPELPYPVHRLTVMGWFGVQLFFLASCVTLLGSWRAETDRGRPDMVAFFVRRFFRIAPAYYAAALLYYAFDPPAGGFEAWQAFASISFINAWHPAWTPTIANAWVVVPGGWSIGVEFTFYLLFPWFAACVVTARRAWAVVVASLLLGLAANWAALSVLGGVYAPNEISNFLFFWFPNEMSVFALGGVLFFLLRSAQRPGGRLHATLRNHATLFPLLAFGAFAAFAYIPLGHYLGDRPVMPAFLAVSLPLMGLILALSAGVGPFVNRWVAAFGRVSFSAYLSHFAVLKLLGVITPDRLIHAQGVAAILTFAAAWAVVVPTVFAAAWLSCRIIEGPMIDVGKSIVRSRRATRIPQAL